MHQNKLRMEILNEIISTKLIHKRQLFVHYSNFTNLNAENMGFQYILNEFHVSWLSTKYLLSAALQHIKWLNECTLDFLRMNSCHSLNKQCREIVLQETKRVFWSFLLWMRHLAAFYWSGQPNIFWMEMQKRNCRNKTRRKTWLLA